MESYRFIVSGRVQGVGFRAATRRKALILGLRGWVRNRDDGAVEGVVVGVTAESLREFKLWLSNGPPASHVLGVEWVAAALESHDTFVIRR